MFLMYAVIYSMIGLYFLFNEDHVLHLRPETFAVLGRINMVLEDNDGQMIPGDECGLNFLTIVLQLVENLGKYLN